MSPSTNSFTVLVQNNLTEEEIMLTESAISMHIGVASVKQSSNNSFIVVIENNMSEQKLSTLKECLLKIWSISSIEK
jgi:hypothetical protein